MYNRIFAGSARVWLLVAATVGLVLLPATDALAAVVKAMPSDATRAAAQSRGVGALEDDADAQPNTLYPRTNYQWPFSSGPMYGLELESATIGEEPGIVHTQVGTFDLRRGTPGLPPELRASAQIEAGGSQYFIVVPNPDAMKDGAFAQYRDAIVGTGGAFIQEMGGAYLVRLNTDAYAKIAGQPETLALEPYHPAFKLAPTIGRAPLLTLAEANSDIYKLTLSVFPGEDPAAVAQSIRSLGGNVTRISPIAVEAELHQSKLAQAAAIKAVSFIEERTPLHLWGEETTTVMQTGSFHGGAKPYHDVFINGGGKRGVCTPSGTPCQSIQDCPLADTACSGGPPQVLAIVDSGIQLDAGDLSDTKVNAGTAGPSHRKVRVYEKTDQFPGGAGDLKGCDAVLSGGVTHGHVVASTALGNAGIVPFRYNPATPGVGFRTADSNNVFRPVDGVAPRAVLVAYDAQITPLSGNCDELTNANLVPGDIYTGEGAGASFEVAYHTHGARTLALAWSDVNNAVYGARATQVDNFAANHLDALVVLSAGNDGKDSNRDLVPDSGSISDPATAKNAIVVGGTGDTSEPFNGANEQDRYQNGFTGDGSGVGPATAASGRVAPILMAPAIDFGGIGGNMGFSSEFACRSNDNDQANAVECDVKQGFRGTSVSAGAVAGAAMLVRDYFAEGFYPDGTSTNASNAADVVTTLSAAEIKAILIASADWMDNSTPSVPTNSPGGNLFARYRFNNEQGYGRVQLNNALPLQNYPSPPGLIIADGGIGGGKLDIPGLSGDIDTTNATETDTGTITVCDDSKELRIALAWNDTTGDLLNRNLDLTVISPSGKRYLGNMFSDDTNHNGLLDGLCSGHTATSCVPPTPCAICVGGTNPGALCPLGTECLGGGTCTGSEACTPVEDCPATAYTGSATGLDDSPWSIPVNGCASFAGRGTEADRHDKKNNTEAVMVSPDARLDGRGTCSNNAFVSCKQNSDCGTGNTCNLVFDADKQTELGDWKILVGTGSPTTAGLTRYAVAVAGGTCSGSTVYFNPGGSYVCNEPAIVVVDERDEVGDPLGGGGGLIANPNVVAARTVVQVISKGNDGIFGTADDQVMDSEDASSTNNFGFTVQSGVTGARFVSAGLTLSETPRVPGNGILDVRNGDVLKVQYRDVTNGNSDPNKVRTNIAAVNCQPSVTIGGVVFAQVGFDTTQLIDGGCERDARGLFTFGFPDRYMDQGERLNYHLAFQSTDSDLTDVRVSLRCVMADANSPADCQPGTTQCADPNRTDNPPCDNAHGVNMTILDSPKSIGDLPAGQIAQPSFAIQMGTITGSPEVDMIVGVSASDSGKTVETQLVTRNTLNVDEVSYYYSTDYPSGGTEWKDWPGTTTGQNPSNEEVDGCLFPGIDPKNAKVCTNNHTQPCTVDANCAPPNPGSCIPCPPPQSQPGEFPFGNGADYRFDLVTWSSLTATGRNTFLGQPGNAPWNFESGKQGFSVGMNASSTVNIPDTVANWGEDRNFNGVLDWFCAQSIASSCPGFFQAADVGTCHHNAPCGRCSNNANIICVQAGQPTDNIPCGGGATTCTTDNALGCCISKEDRDPQNGALDDNWGTGGGCGWQTNGTTNNPNQPGGVWHTGRIDIPGPPCLPAGANPGACQSYEILTGTANVKREWEILLSPIFQKVNQCNTDVGPLPANCGGVFDTPSKKVFKVEFMDWAWNQAYDLKDLWADVRWELDADTTSIAPTDLINDTAVQGALPGNQGVVSGGNSPLTDGYQVFANLQGSSSVNGTVGQNRVGRNPCYFETNPQVTPFHMADPWDDDIDNNSNGVVDEDVFPNGPRRNFDVTIEDNPIWDGRVGTLEDVYGVPSGESFQAALGFRVREGNATSGAAASSFGISMDDMVVQWREFKLGANQTDCLEGGVSLVPGTTPVQCATVEVESDRVYQGNGVLTITVTDPSPYRCLGSPPCTPTPGNDCNHNGTFTDTGLCNGVAPVCSDDTGCPVGQHCVGADDTDCNDNGIPDVLARGFTPFAEPAGEWVVLDQVGSSKSYRGTLPISIGGNVAGVLYVTDLGGLNNDITVRYQDDWDGSTLGSKCGNNPDPGKQGFVDDGINLVITDTANVVVTAFRIDDSIPQSGAESSDADGYPDTNELVNLYVTVSNKSHQNLTHLVVQASVNDPKIECLLSSVSTLASLNADVTTELPIPFQFKVSGLADRGGLVPVATCTGNVCSNGAGACTVVTDCQKTVISDYSALFLITLSADQFDINRTQQQIALDLDLDSANPSIATSTFTEGFEGGFGNFQFLNLDFNIAANSLSNGMRCQYNDPDFINSNSYGDTQCYLGFVAGQSPVNDWHVHTTSSPDLGRAYLGTQSLHYGKHTPGTPTLDTYGLSQMDAIRTKSNINLAARICQNDPSANKKSCTLAADCVSVGGGPCVSASPVFSFKHQVSTTDNRGTNTPAGQAADRAVVHAQLNTSAVWQKLFPYQNVYDAQGTDNFSNCLFDPTDDGNNEDSYFDPTDPQRRLGPSSTCFPEFIFCYLGNTDKPFQAVNTGRASDPPGLQGSLGPGVWVESKFDLSRYRGRAIKLRYVITSIKVADVQTLETLFKWNPSPEDDGWYIDDIRVTQTLGASAPTVTNDTKNNGNTSCGAKCNNFTVAPSLTGSPSTTSAPGRETMLTAAATVDRCANGTLLYQFWQDVNGNGLIDPVGTPATCVSLGPSPGTDCILRDFSTNPSLPDAPTATTKYITRIRCSTATAGVCDGTGTATVTVTSPCTAVMFPWRTLFVQGDKKTLNWVTAPQDPTSPAGSVEVIRGDLNMVRTNGGNFNPSVLACVANDTAAGTAIEAPDPGNPVPPVIWYYLARQSVAPPGCTVNTTWSPHPTSAQEVAGAGGTRDADLTGAANLCPAGPP